MIKFNNTRAVMAIMRSCHVLNQFLVLYFAQCLLIVFALHGWEIFTMLFFHLK